MAVVRKLEPVAQNDEATGPTEAQVLAVINAAVSILGARLLLVIGAIGALFWPIWRCNRPIRWRFGRNPFSA